MCLEEDVKMMPKCIQLDMECASTCYSAAQVMILWGKKVKELCGICANICDECAAECATHDHEHCKEVQSNGSLKNIHLNAF